MTAPDATGAKLVPLTRETLARQTSGKVSRLAEMVQAAAPDFYALVPLPAPSILQVIGGQIGVTGTELAGAYVLRRDRADVAMFAILPASRLANARQAGALDFIRLLSGTDRALFMVRLRNHGAAVEPLEPTGVYLARVAVDARHRRFGYGLEAMRHVVRLAGEEDLSLHVHGENTSAIALYSRIGFRFLSDKGEFTFRVMARKAYPIAAPGGPISNV